MSRVAEISLTLPFFPAFIWRQLDKTGFDCLTDPVLGVFFDWVTLGTQVAYLIMLQLPRLPNPIFYLTVYRAEAMFDRQFTITKYFQQTHYRTALKNN